MKDFGFIKTLLVLAVLLLSVRLLDIYLHNKDFENVLVDKTYAQAPEQKEVDEKEQAKITEVGPGEEDSLVSVEQIKTFTEEEIDILKRLADRRNRLLEWEEELEVKANVLSLTEEKIDKKLEELRVLKKKVEEALREYRKEEDKKTQSLVKIYENMKPKNAADIMAKMNINNILPIVDKMKEKNAAEILGKMDPRIAKEITSRLAEIGRLQN